MNGNPRHWARAAALSAVLAATVWTVRAPVAATPVAPAAQSPAGTAQAAMPRYDTGGALLLPEDYRRWVMIGASLGISYSDAPSTHEMFAHTLMEPTAYRHFVETGTFREGTMFALLLQAAGDKVLPARRGQFANDVHGVEMAVKDSAHVPEGWAYYGFGGMAGNIQRSATAQPKSSCFSCHAEHAARDHVFLQFYPLLSDAAGTKGR